MRWMLWAGVMGFALSGFAQTTAPQPAAGADTDAASAKPLTYDAVSVRQNKTDSHVSWDKTPPDGYAVEHMPLRYVISAAYGIRPDLISGGPGWVDSSYWDIQAKIAGEDLDAYHKLGKRKRDALMQAVLADRFKLAAHVETKELPGYELVVAKGGPKLVDTKFKHQSYGANPGDFMCEAITIPVLARLLSEHIRQTVTDKTGLTGKYDFELKWAADRPGAPAEDDSAAAPEASLFTAVQEQLGLRLNPVKGPVDTLVIDHVELPSEN